ncbi:MAG TPA: hypothetical protein VF743_04840 [Acidimicrobiales bacterium]
MDVGTEVGTALRTIVVPDHDDAFWEALGDELADEPQLRLRPRAAVRPITQPPPIIDDRLPFDDGDLIRSRRRMPRRRLAVWIGAIVLSVLLVVSAAQDPDDGDDVRSAGGATTSSLPATTAPAVPGAPATTPPAPIDPALGLTPAGVGPLSAGAILRDLQGGGIPVVVDQPTFTGTGGTCFDATVAGVPDLVLRFRSPNPGQGIADPGDGVLGSVAVDAQLGSTRTTEAGIGLGATEDQVRAAYGDVLQETDHPYVPGGHIFTHEPPGDGADTGIAFMTDGRVVTGIVVGDADLIGYPEGCA